MVLDQFQRRGGVQGPGHDARDPQAATARGRGPERRGQEALDWAAEARAVHGAAAEFFCALDDFSGGDFWTFLRRI